MQPTHGRWAQFDLASLTKVIATTSAVMLLYQASAGLSWPGSTLSALCSLLSALCSLLSPLSSLLSPLCSACSALCSPPWAHQIRLGRRGTHAQCPFPPVSPTALSPCLLLVCPIPCLLHARTRSVARIRSVAHADESCSTALTGRRGAPRIAWAASARCAGDGVPRPRLRSERQGRSQGPDSLVLVQVLFS